jgi:hypothetical protein
MHSIQGPIGGNVWMECMSVEWYIQALTGLYSTRSCNQRIFEKNEWLLAVDATPELRIWFYSRGCVCLPSPTTINKIILLSLSKNSGPDFVFRPGNRVYVPPKGRSHVFLVFGVQGGWPPGWSFGFWKCFNHICNSEDVSYKTCNL